MALNKIITNEKGVTTSYHKIKEVNVIKAKEEILRDENRRPIMGEDGKPIKDTAIRYHLLVTLLSFVSADIRQESELLAAEEQQISIKCTLDELASTPILALCYGKLKQSALLTGAEDC